MCDVFVKAFVSSAHSGYRSPKNELGRNLFWLFSSWLFSGTFFHFLQYCQTCFLKSNCSFLCLVLQFSINWHLKKLCFFLKNFSWVLEDFVLYKIHELSMTDMVSGSINAKKCEDFKSQVRVIFECTSRNTFFRY